MNLSSQWSSIFIFFLIGASPAFCQKNNSKPQIVGQTPSPLATPEGIPISIQLTNLIVNDPDTSYPNGFALKLFAGKDYTLNGNTVTPSDNFSGNLKVPVTVNDGQNESNRFELKIDVIKAANAAPRITAQSPLSVNQGGSITVELSHLQVTDPDNSYTTGFTIRVFGGNNYTFNGTTITPSKNFVGQLTVSVTVNDGKEESNRFELKIDVIKMQNVAPQITGQQPLAVNQN